MIINYRNVDLKKLSFTSELNIFQTRSNQVC